MILNIETLLDGEKALENAPKTELADGRFCIPQHYLSYQHTLKSVEQILLDIDCDPRYPILPAKICLIVMVASTYRWELLVVTTTKRIKVSKKRSSMAESGELNRNCRRRKLFRLY